MERRDGILPQPLQARDEKLVRTVYERLHVWKRGCAEIHDRARMARKVFLLQDPMQDAPGTPPEKRTLQLQTLKSTINSCIADQMDNMPEIRLLPERPELKETAGMLEDVLRFVLEQNRFESFQRRRVEDYFVTGTAVTQVAWDPDMNEGKGEVALIRWPVEAFLWDPEAEDIQESRAVMKVSWHPISWYESRYPEKAKYIAGEDARFGDVGLPESQSGLTDVEEKAMLVEYWWREYDAGSRRWRVNAALLAGGALLERKENVYAHGRYPFVCDVFSRIEGVCAGEGMVMELAPMMRYINRYAHYIDENLRMSAKIRMLVRKNANIDVGALADWNENLIGGDAIDEESVRWLQSKPLSPMAASQMLQFQVDLKQDSGQNQFTRGETAGGVTAASAISALQEAGGKISRMRTDALNAGTREIGEMALWLISQFYTRERTRMITGMDGRPYLATFDGATLMGDAPMLTGEEKILPGDVREKVKERIRKGKKARAGRPLPPPPYVVEIAVQKRNPLRIQAQNELLMRAYEMAKGEGQAFSLDTLFSLMNVDGKEQVISAIREASEKEKRYREMDETAGEVDRMEGENETLRRQTAELEYLVGLGE